MGEFGDRYNASQHPDVRTGKKTEEQVLGEFMDGFETQHALITGDQSQNDDKITLDEFMEYYNNVSINIDNDSYFDLMISNAWGLEGSNNPAAMPYAGVSKKVQKVNAREAYRADHHRNLFGTDKKTPFAKGQGANWSSSQQSAMRGEGMADNNPAAGTTTFYNQDAYKNQFGSERTSGAEHSGITMQNDELI